MDISTYSVRLKSDNGVVRIKTAATSEESAKKIVCTAEKYPEHAVLSVRKLKS